jgi:hypothetical protein
MNWSMNWMNWSMNARNNEIMDGHRSEPLAYTVFTVIYIAQVFGMMVYVLTVGICAVFAELRGARSIGLN